MQKDEKEVYNMMKPFARFSSKQEHEQLCKSILEER
jgi:hypothetical protein